MRGFLSSFPIGILPQQWRVRWKRTCNMTWMLCTCKGYGVRDAFVKGVIGVLPECVAEGFPF